MSVFNFDKEKEIAYPYQQELHNRIIELVLEYGNDMSLAASLGVIDLAKDTLISDAKNE